MKQQLEGGQSAASAEVERLKEQLQQMTVTVETQQQRWVGGILCISMQASTSVYLCIVNDSGGRYNSMLVGNADEVFIYSLSCCLSQYH